MTRNAQAFLLVAAILFTLAVLCGCGGGDYDPKEDGPHASIQPPACKVDPSSCV